MGLDMYLERMPRYRHTTAKDVSAVSNYFSWVEHNAQEEKEKYTFKEWCGISKMPSQHMIDFYKPYYTKKYSHWDTEHEYGYMGIMEQVGYWRKANHIHAWFVDYVQDGIDDCDYHNEVTKEDLEDLLDICQRVLDDHSLADELLPTQSGFFFGGTEYDEYYFEDIENTIGIIKNVLETTDFDKEMIYYVSSW
jgi:hypothetical protein